MKNNDFELGLPTVLFVVFLVLKLTNNIDWSWWWVTAPLWIPAGLVLLIFLIIAIAAVFGAIFGKDDD